ncbi:hypothetical protein GT037_008056 [Alternaria burnsii]|uniref:Uncharacterized protein n=1 Tax=Alternaria burnsii TaxID=1187904 RepID=A0A8H7EE34_9PLEO|nr:uncharacterized protein GT037_008056 [Alternaria burnsii]KAF7674290.1 hypothetical protein GT037_008056 [Alternaria burnsii]
MHRVPGDIHAWAFRRPPSYHPSHHRSFFPTTPAHCCRPLTQTRRVLLYRIFTLASALDALDALDVCQSALQPLASNGSLHCTYPSPLHYIRACFPHPGPCLSV